MLDSKPHRTFGDIPTGTTRVELADIDHIRTMRTDRRTYHHIGYYGRPDTYHPYNVNDARRFLASREGKRVTKVVKETYYRFRIQLRDGREMPEIEFLSTEFDRLWKGQWIELSGVGKMMSYRFGTLTFLLTDTYQGYCAQVSIEMPGEILKHLMSRPKRKPFESSWTTWYLRGGRQARFFRPRVRIHWNDEAQAVYLANRTRGSRHQTLQDKVAQLVNMARGVSSRRDRPAILYLSKDSDRGFNWSYHDFNGRPMMHGGLIDHDGPGDYSIHT